MAVSRFQSSQYMAEKFVESAGAILFRLSTKKICVLHLLKRDEYVLAKGRRNCGETNQAAALREVTEETGYPCHILPLDMSVRCPPSVEMEQLGDQARFYTKICEPITLQIRQLAAEETKLIWWYVAAVSEGEPMLKNLQEDGKISVVFLSYADALNKLTFQMDREMVQRAIHLVSNTYDKQPL